MKWLACTSKGSQKSSIKYSPIALVLAVATKVSLFASIAMEVARSSMMEIVMKCALSATKMDWLDAPFAADEIKPCWLAVVVSFCCFLILTCINSLFFPDLLSEF